MNCFLISARAAPDCSATTSAAPKASAARRQALPKAIMEPSLAGSAKLCPAAGQSPDGRRSPTGAPELVPAVSIQFCGIAGLDPAIHPLCKMLYAKVMDPRVKPAGDGGSRCEH